MRLSEKISKAFYILNKNPELFKKFLNYRLKRLGKKWRTEYSGIQQISLGDINFQINFDQLGSSLYAKQMYFKSYELHVVEILNKFLKPGGIFIDVGANLGYISAIAASIVGKDGLVIAFEPVPYIFENLKSIKTLNPDHNIVIHHQAISENNQPITINCTSFADCGRSSAIYDFLAINQIKVIDKISVDSTRLDDYLFKNNIQNISIIKIDVEGYEFSILKSLERFLSTYSHRPMIITEIAPAALHLLKLETKDVFDYMKKFNYQAYDVYDLKTKLRAELILQTTDVVFICN